MVFGHDAATRRSPHRLRRPVPVFCVTGGPRGGRRLGSRACDSTSGAGLPSPSHLVRRAASRRRLWPAICRTGRLRARDLFPAGGADRDPRHPLRRDTHVWRDSYRHRPSAGGAGGWQCARRQPPAPFDPLPSGRGRRSAAWVLFRRRAGDETPAARRRGRGCRILALKTWRLWSHPDLSSAGMETIRRSRSAYAARVRKDAAIGFPHSSLDRILVIWPLIEGMMPLTTGPIVGLFVGRHVGAWAWSDRKAPLAAAIRARHETIFTLRTDTKAKRRYPG